MPNLPKKDDKSAERKKLRDLLDRAEKAKLNPSLASLAVTPTEAQPKKKAKNPARAK